MIAHGLYVYLRAGGQLLRRRNFSQFLANFDWTIVFINLWCNIQLRVNMCMVMFDWNVRYATQKKYLIESKKLFVWTTFFDLKKWFV